MTDRARHPRVAGLSWPGARSVARTAALPLGVERIPFGSATGRIIADDVVASAPLPGFDASAMDGYAVAGSGPWRVIGRVMAGHAGWPNDLIDGTAVEVMTGAPVPAGAEAVVPYEVCRRDGSMLCASSAHPGHIRRAGEDAGPGDVVVAAGQLVTAAATGAIAQAGVDVLTVYRKPRVAIMVTGDEVIRTGVPRSGQVRDALGPLVAAIVEQAAGIAVDYRLIADDADLLTSAIESTMEADVLVVTGSSSVGLADHLRAVLERTGATWHVDGVLCRPGHPQVLARTVDGRWVVGLPGNPFAGLVAALTLVQPLVDALSGRTTRPTLMLPVTGPVHPYSAGTRLVPVGLGGSIAVVVPGARSGNLRPVGSADAIAVIDPGWSQAAPAELLLLS